MAQRSSTDVPCDWQDCQWIQRLHILGLLTASFRPDAEMAVLRSYLRHRAERIQHRAPHILHMQKALHQMNIQLDRVRSDRTGTTGLAILRAIIAGERDAGTLAQLRNPACILSEETSATALRGMWRAEYRFALTQSQKLFDFYTQQLGACDAEIECSYATMKPRFEADAENAIPANLPLAKNGSKSKN